MTRLTFARSVANIRDNLKPSPASCVSRISRKRDK